MTRAAALVWLGTLAACGGDDAPVPDPVAYDVYAALADPLAPARRAPGRMELASSRARDPVRSRVNDDWSHYPAEDGTSKTLVRASGPGAVTRLWFTLRAEEGAIVPELAAQVRLRLEVDGAPLAIAGETDATLEDWTAGVDPRWPAPWVAGYAAASGAYLILIPIQFQRSFVATADVPDDMVVYYQIDWRALPGLTVEPTAVAPTDAQLGVLESVAARWSSLALLGEEMPAASGDPEAVLDVSGPAVIHELRIEDAQPDDLLRIEIDGETIAEDTVGRLMAAPPPLAAPYVSALSLRGARELVLRYPIPLERTFRATARRAPGTTGAIRIQASVAPGPLPPDLGRFHVDCVRAVSGPHGDPTTDVATFTHAGRPGQIAGTSLVLEAAMWGWVMLEGDHEVAIDGDWRILGTGVEDYFGGAFYFTNGPFLALTQGLTGWNDHPDTPGAAMLRHHVIDAVGWQDTIEWRWENYLTGTRYDACTFYYLF